MSPNEERQALEALVRPSAKHGPGRHRVDEARGNRARTPDPTRPAAVEQDGGVEDDDGPRVIGVRYASK
jgi:hypothetical protein